MSPQEQFCRCPRCGADASGDAKSTKPRTLAEAPELLKYTEAASILGCSYYTVRRLIRRNKLRRHPAMKRIVKSDLAGFINEKTRFEKAVVEAARRQ